MKLQNLRDIVFFILVIVAPLVSLVSAALIAATNGSEIIASRQLSVAIYQLAFQGYLIAVTLVLVIFMWKILVILTRISNQLRDQHQA